MLTPEMLFSEVLQFIVHQKAQRVEAWLHCSGKTLVEWIEARIYFS